MALELRACAALRSSARGMESLFSGVSESLRGRALTGSSFLWDLDAGIPRPAIPRSPKELLAFGLCSCFGLLPATKE